MMVRWSCPTYLCQQHTTIPRISPFPFPFPLPFHFRFPFPFPHSPLLHMWFVCHIRIPTPPLRPCVLGYLFLPSLNPQSSPSSSSSTIIIKTPYPQPTSAPRRPAIP